MAESAAKEVTTFALGLAACGLSVVGAPLPPGLVESSAAAIGLGRHFSEQRRDKISKIFNAIVAEVEAEEEKWQAESRSTGRSEQDIKSAVAVVRSAMYLSLPTPAEITKHNRNVDRIIDEMLKKAAKLPAGSAITDGKSTAEILARAYFKRVMKKGLSRLLDDEEFMQCLREVMIEETHDNVRKLLQSHRESEKTRNQVLAGLGEIANALGRDRESIQRTLQDLPEQFFGPDAIQALFPPLRGDTLTLIVAETVPEIESSCLKKIDDVVADEFPGLDLNTSVWRANLAASFLAHGKSDLHPLQRLSDQGCIAVVAIASTGIGNPLQGTFPQFEQPTYVEWLAKEGRSGILHPWPQDAEAKELALKNGNYPLTAFVLATMEAHHAGREVGLAIYSPTASEHGDPALENLASAMRNHNLPTCTATSVAEFGEMTSRLIADQLDVSDSEAPNPYRFLNYFDIGHKPRFFGRQSEIGEARRKLSGWMAGGGGVSSLRILGDSGCGKTSLLRAGIMAAFIEDGVYGAVMRPTDFHNDYGIATDVLEKLIEHIAEETDVRVPASELRRLRNATLERKPEIAVRIVADGLEALAGPRGRMLIGLDQLEEIVDVLARAESIDSPRMDAPLAEWLSLLKFVERACKTGNIGLLYTLERSREKAFSEVTLPQAITEAYELPIIGRSPDFLREIIRLPFKRGCFRLDDAIVDNLISQTAELTNSAKSGGYGGSPLPLLALKLANLYEYVAHQFPDRRWRGSGKLGGAFRAHTPKSIGLEDVGDSLDIQSEISALAEDAWRNGAEQDADKEDALDHYLRPLVRIEAGRVALGTVGERPYHTERKIDVAFLERRLLVPSDGRWRLVHESVIHWWPRAARWFEANSESMETEAIMRLQAQIWDTQGRPESELRSSEHDVESAVVILADFVRSWALGIDSAIDEKDVLLRDYCRSVLAQSETPLKVVPGSKKGRKYVHIAAQNGMTDLLAKFAECEPSCLFDKSDDGDTPLTRAAWAHFDTVKYLLEQGADPVARNEAGWPAIGSPIVTGRSDIFELLWPHYKPEDLRGPNQHSVLRHCAQFDRVDFARTLIDKVGLDPNETFDEEKSLAIIAAIYGSLSAYEHFASLADPVKTDTRGFTPLHSACWPGHRALVETMLADPRYDGVIDSESDGGYTPLMLAALWRHAETTATLLDHCDPNRPYTVDNQFKGFTALHFAIEGTTSSKKKAARSELSAVLTTVRSILRHPDANPNLKSESKKTPFELAKRFPAVRMELLRDPRFDASSHRFSNGRTPLMAAAKAGWRNVVERILTEIDHEELHAVDDSGTTAAVEMVRSGMGDLVRHLIESNRLDPWNAAKAKGALLTEVMKRSDRVLGSLILERIAPETPEEVLEGPLHYACAAGNIDLTKHLLEAGASPNAKEKEMGRNTLHVAAAFGNVPMVELLLANEADTSIRDRWGRHPVDMSPAGARDSIARLCSQTVAPVSERPTQTLFHPSAPGWTDVENPDHVISELDNAAEHGLGPRTTLREQVLPFYPEASLLLAENPEWHAEAPNRYFISHQSKLLHLNGTSPPIHKLNKKALALDEDNLLEYLEFFCFFVRAEEGPFLIVNDLDNAYVPLEMRAAASESAEAAQELRRLFRLPQLVGEDDDEGWRASAMVYYSNAVFLADFLIKKSGMIEMLSDFPLLDNLPAKVHAPV